MKPFGFENPSSRDPKSYCVMCINKYTPKAVNYKGQKNVPEKKSN